MLVKVDDRAELSAAEDEFVTCLRALPITGLAVVGLRIGTQRGTRRIGAMIWTEQGILVCEIVGFRSAQSGALTISSDRPWQVGAVTADLDLEFRADPLAGLHGAVREVEQTFQRAAYDPGPLSGAVVLVPWRGSALQPGRVSIRPGVDIVAGNRDDSTDLRIYLENFAPGPPRWTLSRVCAATRALIGWAPTRTELLDAGFEDKLPDPTRPPRRRPTWRVPDSGRRQDILGWIVLAIAVIGMLAVLVAIIAAPSSSNGSPDPEPQTPTTTAEAGLPAPLTPTTCWPLQSDC